MKPHLILNSGAGMPVLGMGTWKLDRAAAASAVSYAATRAGYRHIDCASIYGNEAEVGQAFRYVLAGNVKREELFVTSKLWNTEHAPERVEAALRKTLADLQLEYLDLYLVHWGIAFQPGDGDEPLDTDGWVRTERVPLQTTWQAMERLVDQGLVRAIGVSNFTVPMLLDLLTYARIKPAVNQVELHPYLTQDDLLAFCRHEGIVVTAYSPFGSQGPQAFSEPVLAQLAAKHNKTAAQILLRWAIDRGTVAIPKSSHPGRLSENADIFDFKLSASEQHAITALNRNQRFVDPAEWWGVPYFA